MDNGHPAPPPQVQGSIANHLHCLQHTQPEPEAHGAAHIGLDHAQRWPHKVCGGDLDLLRKDDINFIRIVWDVVEKLCISAVGGAGQRAVRFLSSRIQVPHNMTWQE